MKTALYRHFDADGRLLYVGISDALSARDQQHRAVAPWHSQIVRTETQWLNSRDHAVALERVAIQYEKPLHNLANTRALLPSKAQGREAALVDLIEAAASAMNLAPSTLGEKLGQGGRFYSRIKAGCGVLPKTEASVRQKLVAMMKASA